MTNDKQQTNGLNRGSAHLRDRASHRVRTLSIAGGAAALAGTAALTVAMVPAGNSPSLVASTTTVTTTGTTAGTTAATATTAPSTLTTTKAAASTAATTSAAPTTAASTQKATVASSGGS
jgi:hypothetical protein